MVAKGHIAWSDHHIHWPDMHGTLQTDREEVGPWTP